MTWLRRAFLHLAGRREAPNFDALLGEAIEIYGTTGIRVRAFERQQAAAFQPPNRFTREKETNQ